MFTVDLEIQDTAFTMTLPLCLDLGIVADLHEYLVETMRPFPVRQVAHKLIFAMPRILTEREVERFIKLLRGRVDCWYACYPAKVEEKRHEVAMIGQHLKVVRRGELG
jgi:hypothetical protein